MSKISKSLSSHAHIIGWCLICIGWFASSYLGYRFGSRRYAQEKAEVVFEEVSVLIEQANFIMDALDRSFEASHPPDSRVDLWQDLSELQKMYLSNQSRLQFLLNKYFGNDIASKVDFVMRGLLDDPDLQKLAEENGQLSRNYVAYEEVWKGVHPVGPWSGYKWKMMAKCGMDVGPFMSILKKSHIEWQQQLQVD